MNVYPAQARHLKQVRRNQSAIGDYWCAVRFECTDAREELRILSAHGLKELDATFGGQDADGRPNFVTAPPRRCIGPRQDRYDLMLRVQYGL